MTLRELSEQLAIKKHSNVPEHARPVKKFSEAGANELTKAILAYFELKDIYAFRQSSEGRYLPPKTYKDVLGQTKTIGTGKYIPRSNGGTGKADITVTLPPLGRRLEIEIKYKRDVQSDVQKEYQKEIEAMGGIYIIVRTWDGFQHSINQILK